VVEKISQGVEAEMINGDGYGICNRGGVVSGVSVFG